ncbi:MAG: TrkA family potassium uptake protein [Oscillospiraceae bacterium]|nr:TrkA family potassium uptake protein [Oscillospiraceae bacterium]
MRIVVAGGRTQADFLIGTLVKKKHKVIVINDDKSYCEYLTNTHKTPVFFGDPSKYFVLDEAGIKGFDVLVALTHRDADNLAICQYAKRCFGVKKVICTVANPKNVNIFKELGMDTVISSTHMVAQYIAQATNIENITKGMNIEDDRVVIFETVVEPTFGCVNKTLIDITLPANTIIGCIIRKTSADIIVPTGTTELKVGDKLLIITSPENQKKAEAAIRS